MERIYESAVETAKKIRKTLKASFPGVKFSVTSSTYSMGCSVSVHWTDGPMQYQVDEITDQFKSSTFDAMQDMKVTTGYMYEGKLYSGADYVHTSRSLTPEYRATIEEKADEMFSCFNPQSWESGRQMQAAEKALLGLDEVQPEEQEEATPAAVVEEVQPSLAKVINFTAKRQEVEEQKQRDFNVESFLKDVIPLLNESELLAIATAKDHTTVRTEILRAMVRIRLTQ